MNTTTHTHRSFLILAIICTLAISALACNLSRLVIEPQYDEPRYGEEGQYEEREEFYDEDEYRSEDGHDEAYHGEEEDRREGGEFNHEGEEPRHEEEEFHHEGEEPRHEEGEFHHEGEEPRHEGENHHEEEEFHHEGEHHHEEGEPPQGEECPPESECPHQPGYGEESGIRTDLAVTDIFPENLPFGDLKVRITNHGPTPLTTYPAEVICHAHGVSWGGPAHGEEDRNSHQQIILSLGPGDTDEFEAGITIDANLYQYEVVCEVWTDIDSQHHNNVYMEMVPSSNSSP